MSNRNDNGLHLLVMHARVLVDAEDVTIHYSPSTGLYEVDRRRRSLGKDTNYLLSVAAFRMEAQHIVPGRHLEYVRRIAILSVGWKPIAPQVQRDIANAKALLEREPDWAPGLKGRRSRRGA